MEERVRERNARASRDPHAARNGPMKFPRVLFATSEVTPLIKTGGLADVSAALPAALAARGCDVRVLLPGYTQVLDQLRQPQRVERGELGGHAYELLEARCAGLPPLWVVDCPTLFARSGNPYLGPDGQDWPDNAARFALFGRVLASCACRETHGFQPDVVHLNDWQTGIGCALIAGRPVRPALVFTIHNLNFQGLFESESIDRLDLPPALGTMDALEFHGRVSYIKGGLVFADALTTVSPSYAREVQTPTFGAGLDGLLRHRAADLTGILNGIDTHTWNPATDALIPVNYDLASLERKRANKRALQERMRLPASDAPLLGIVTRLTEQKGIDLVLSALPSLRALGVQLVVLGSGAADFERALAAAADAHPAQVGFAAGYDEPLAHLIEAGADLFLMPSRFEPCGLNQMYSMAYGTLPVVHRTGGLADTVRQAEVLSPNASTAEGDLSARAATGVAGTGFVFDRATTEDLIAAVVRALEFWRVPARWRLLQSNAMAGDFSWTASSGRYLDLYRQILQRRATMAGTP